MTPTAMPDTHRRTRSELMLNAHEEWMVKARATASLPTTWLLASSAVMLFYSLGLLFTGERLAPDALDKMAIYFAGTPPHVRGAFIGIVALWGAIVSPFYDTRRFLATCVLHALLWAVPFYTYIILYGVSTNLIYGGLMALPLVAAWKAVQVRLQHPALRPT